MLEKINKDSYGVFDWKVKTGVTDSEISIAKHINECLIVLISYMEHVYNHV